MLRLREGEFACYSLYDVTVLSSLEVGCYASEPSVLEVYQDDALLGRFDLSASEERQNLSGMRLNNADACVLKLITVRGCADVEVLVTDTEP